MLDINGCKLLHITAQQQGDQYSVGLLCNVTRYSSFNPITTTNLSNAFPNISLNRTFLIESHSQAVFNEPA